MGPLSPLLSNIMLDELDKELIKRGHKFVRYADDLMIFCKSKRSAERVLENIVLFIERSMEVSHSSKLNTDKSGSSQDRIFNANWLLLKSM